MSYKSYKLFLQKIVEEKVRGSSENLELKEFHTTSNKEAFVNVETTIRSGPEGQLDAIVLWELNDKLKNKPYNFMVFMARTTCNLHDGYPHCEETDRMVERFVKSSTSKANVVFKYLNYNSKYWLEVSYKEVRSHKVWLNTAPCRKFQHNNFTKCLDNSTHTSHSEPNYMAYKSGSWLKPDITCSFYDKGTDTGYVWLDWSRFESPSHLSSTIENSGEEQELGDTIGLPSNLPLTRASNKTSVENVVLVTFKTKNVPHSQFYHPSMQNICLLVHPEIVYDVKIKSRVGDHDIIFDHLFINVSRSLHSNYTCITMFQNLTVQHQDQLIYWFIGVTLVAILIIVIFSVFVLFCGKCRKAHTKLLKKTLLAKNNSYKTAPGTSVLYLKEHRQQSRDDYELDAREVTLGAEIGQGAFGLVMTGYYRDCQVAIKVLKGDVSPSYRDELLREIQLMKNIGSHPNIVSLVGACTLMDPIALIMEYMPFGNLQLFLQKWCMEGELYKTDNGAEMNYCSTDPLTGLKEMLCLSATDLLSFARQIALAMEFVTEKKYVHRDLAARNVLVTTSKVVKLCDFGLARIVCNGDQYCKLTNGRLPLKWMALESIKDRIFTVQSDIWSYGIFLWEITTFGSTPYPNVALVDLYRLLSEGYRMEKPPNCSRELYHLMSCCWQEKSSKRPSFSSLRLHLESLLSQKENYLDLDLLTTSLPHLKRPPTPVQAIEFCGSGFSWKGEKGDISENVWESCRRNEYQEPRNMFGEKEREMRRAKEVKRDRGNESDFSSSGSEHEQVFNQLV